jgi:hypothetical protein
MKRELFACLLALLFLLPARGVTAQTTDELSRDEKWREDLQTLARELPQRHKNLFAHLARQHFEQEVTQLSEAVPKLSDAEIRLGLWRLAAKIGDAHTQIQYQREQVLPIGLYQFSDGVFVAAAVEEHKALLGAQLIKLGDTGIEDAKAAVRQVIPVENESWFNAQFPSYFTDPQLLALLKILPDAQDGRFTFKGRDGKEFTRKLQPVSAKEQLKLLRPFDATPNNIPLLYRNPQSFYWYELMPESKTLYLQYNRCQPMPEKPFKDFADEVWKLVDEQTVERLVIDLRRNGGGNSSVFDPFINALSRHPRLNRKGKIFVLIGRSTFSSAYLNALRLKRDTRAILVGEPTGQRPNAYGEVKNFTLPHSKIVVNYSTKYFQTMPGDPPSLAPDYVVERSSKDFLDGRDPVLEWVLRYKAK